MDKWTENILLEVNRTKGPHGGRVIRVINWTKPDGTVTKPVLEKRQFFQTEGFIRYGKIRGLDMKDLNILVDNWDKIAETMESHSRRKGG